MNKPLANLLKKEKSTNLHNTKMEIIQKQRHYIYYETVLL